MLGGMRCRVQLRVNRSLRTGARNGLPGAETKAQLDLVDAGSVDPVGCRRRRHIMTLMMEMTMYLLLCTSKDDKTMMIISSDFLLLHPPIIVGTQSPQYLAPPLEAIGLGGKPLGNIYPCIRTTKRASQADYGPGDILAWPR